MMINSWTRKRILELEADMSLASEGQEFWFQVMRSRPLNWNETLTLGAYQSEVFRLSEEMNMLLPPVPFVGQGESADTFDQYN